MKKIEKSLVFDGIKFEKKTEKQEKYYKISLYFSENMGKIYFYYLEKLLENQYFLPIFKCDIYGMLLYFLYLVYIMHLNIIKTSKTVKELEDLGENLENNGHIELMKKG